MTGHAVFTVDGEEIDAPAVWALDGNLGRTATT